MTAYGHVNLALEAHWELMGAIESLNGWLLFGLTTAFLFAVIQRVGLLDSIGGVDDGIAAPAEFFGTSQMRVAYQSARFFEQTADVNIDLPIRRFGRNEYNSSG